MPSTIAIPAFLGNAQRAQRGTSAFLACGLHHGLGSIVNKLACRHAFANCHATGFRESKSKRTARRKLAALKRLHTVSGRCGSAVFCRLSKFCRQAHHLPHGARPNPSVKRSANGRPPVPGPWHTVHHHSPGTGVLPLSPAYLER